jgi:hypothetical protein
MVRECHVARVVGVEGGDIASMLHTSAIFMGSITTGEISRLKLEASGSFVDESRGTGVLSYGDRDSFTEFASGAEYRVVDSIFVDNQATRGGAIGVSCDDVEIIVLRCFFEVGTCQLWLYIHVGSPRYHAIYFVRARRATWRP